jgi:hypothetical protein
MIRSLKDASDKEAARETLENIARYMRTKSYEYNQEHPNNEIIIGDIKRMSRGGITLDEAALGSLKSEYRSAGPAMHHKKGHGGGKNPKNNGRGGGQRRRAQ